MDLSTLESSDLGLLQDPEFLDSVVALENTKTLDGRCFFCWTSLGCNYSRMAQLCRLPFWEVSQLAARGSEDAPGPGGGTAGYRVLIFRSLWTLPPTPGGQGLLSRPCARGMCSGLHMDATPVLIDTVLTQLLPSLQVYREGHGLPAGSGI